ncbi:MAG: flagellar FlbD family protein [Oscillospiraceae bacterium]|nr:flagellar FlbD family protein [Oscillospiraceae bacterium]
MVRLTKLNSEEIVVNTHQIQTIEIIPESKIVFTNKEFLIVMESADEIIEKIIDFNAKVYDLHSTYTIEKLGFE